MNKGDIYEILDRAYESEDSGEIADLAEQALALDPENPEALLLKADLIDDDDERLPYLEKALEEARKYFQKEGLSGEDIWEDDMGPVYLGALQRAAYTLFSLEQDDRSFELVEELLRYDHEDQTMAKTLYYRILLEREEWSRALEETMKETTRGLGWAYARLIASFMLSGGKNEKNLGKVNKMLWDAVRMAPNVPFYMLGYVPDPVDETEEDDFHFSLLYENVWPTSSQTLRNWFSKATILFGLLTGRFGQESDDMEEILASLGGASDYEELSRHLKSESDDKPVLDALVSGNYPSKR
jgi:tetratricopeptide (TPR) repeat protein